jgi:hypothetical protein
MRRDFLADLGRDRSLQCERAAPLGGPVNLTSERGLKNRIRE